MLPHRHSMVAAAASMAVAAGVTAAADSTIPTVTAASGGDAEHRKILDAMKEATASHRRQAVCIIQNTTTPRMASASQPSSTDSLANRRMTLISTLMARLPRSGIGQCSRGKLNNWATNVAVDACCNTEIALGWTNALRSLPPLGWNCY
jgi:hypothetical protein